MTKYYATLTLVGKSTQGNVGKRIFFTVKSTEVVFDPLVPYRCAGLRKSQKRFAHLYNIFKSIFIDMYSYLLMVGTIFLTNNKVKKRRKFAYYYIVCDVQIAKSHSAGTFRVWNSQVWGKIVSGTEKDGDMRKEGRREW